MIFLENELNEKNVMKGDLLFPWRCLVSFGQVVARIPDFRLLYHISG
jgi:hypothetical protein